MEELLHFFAKFIAVLLDTVSFAMMARVIISLLFGGDEGGRLSTFLACITEPFIAPVRFLLVKFNVLQNSPIDWSFTVSYLVIILLRLMLPVV